MSIDSMINTIRKRPGMYLGGHSITALDHFLRGYEAAERDYKTSYQTELFPLDFKYMHDFMSIKRDCHDSIGWRDHILRDCNDEAEALDRFFELYDEFRQMQMKRYWKAVLSEENIQWNNSVEHAYRLNIVDDSRTPIFTNPIAVYVIELTIPAYMLVVETASHIRTMYPFHTTLEQAKGNAVIPEGAECYFGQIDSWEEVVATNIDFGKKVTWWIDGLECIEF